MENFSSEEVNELRHNARTIVRELGLLNNAYFGIDVTLAERHLLIELSVCHSPTMGEIAQRLLLDKSTVSRLISKAIKKGYVKCKTDQEDKRKRFLQLTKKGKQVLNAFELIAFNQTRNALLTLASSEIGTLFQGVALYANGLKNARLQGKVASPHIPEQIETLSVITAQLDHLGYVLEPFNQKDEKQLYEIFKEVIDTGSQFPYECNSIQEFQRQFLNPQGQVYVCRSSTQEVIGGFYIRPNFSGRSGHIANAAYMLRSSCRGKGLGSLLVKASLHLAKNLNFQAMQFNMVLSQNTIATKLYKKLGFHIIGTLPEAVRNSDGSYQDGYVMYRNFDDL